jgi:heme/copper-type cytochrome/quinol oxidase subunit 3
MNLQGAVIGEVRREPVVPNSVLAVLMFTFTETMLFTGLISAHVIFVANQVGDLWPPANQPLLPYQQTAFNSAFLILSGVLLFATHLVFSRRRDRGALYLFGLSILGGLYFVASQGVEWIALIRQGLTMTSSPYGAFFYLIVGTHALHAVAAIGYLVWAWVRMRRGVLDSAHFASVQIFWYFVVAVWPVIFFQVYRL